MKQTKRTIHKYSEWQYNREFENSDNGITILNHLWWTNLNFQNSKKWVVKSFHKALWMFLKNIEEIKEVTVISNWRYKKWEKRKKLALQFLKENGMDTEANIALINAVQFTPEAIEIGWVRRAWENLKASDVGMQYTQDSQENPADYSKAHVFSGNPDFPEENYFTREAINKLQQQWKVKLPTDTDMENTLKALPWYTKRWSWKKWSAKILSILLWTQMSYRRAGERNNTLTDGYLRSASPHVSNAYDAWAFKRVSSEGKLDSYNKELAFPCRTVL